MIQLRPANETDIQHLRESLTLDEWHKGETPEQWINCNGGLTTFFDESGPVFHMAFDIEGTDLRVNIQFDPRCGRKRTAATLLDAFDKVTHLATERGIERIVFKSESPDLIAFMGRLGFTKLNQEDYALSLSASR